MTPPDPRIGLPLTEAEWDEQFAAFAADLAAHADDPGKDGAWCRELLAEDPQELRAMWEFSMVAGHGMAGPMSPANLIATFFVLAMMLTLAFWVLR